MKQFFKKWFVNTCETTQANKLCKKCDTNKSVSDFHKNKSAKDGLQDYCKTCRSLRKSCTVKSHRRKKRMAFFKKASLEKATSQMKILDVPIKYKRAFYQLAQQKKMTSKQLGHQMFHDFLILNNVDVNKLGEK